MLLESTTPVSSSRPNLWRPQRHRVRKRPPVEHEERDPHGQQQRQPHRQLLPRQHQRRRPCRHGSFHPASRVSPSSVSFLVLARLMATMIAAALSLQTHPHRWGWSRSTVSWEGTQHQPRHPFTWREPSSQDGRRHRRRGAARPYHPSDLITRSALPPELLTECGESLLQQVTTASTTTSSVPSPSLWLAADPNAIGTTFSTWLASTFTVWDWTMALASTIGLFSLLNGQNQVQEREQIQSRMEIQQNLLKTITNQMNALTTASKRWFAFGGVAAVALLTRSLLAPVTPTTMEGATDVITFPDTNTVTIVSSSNTGTDSLLVSKAESITPLSETRAPSSISTLSPLEQWENKVTPPQAAEAVSADTNDDPLPSLVEKEEEKDKSQIATPTAIATTLKESTTLTTEPATMTMSQPTATTTREPTTTTNKETTTITNKEPATTTMNEPTTTISAAASTTTASTTGDATAPATGPISILIKEDIAGDMETVSTAPTKQKEKESSVASPSATEFSTTAATSLVTNDNPTREESTMTGAVTSIPEATTTTTTASEVKSRVFSSESSIQVDSTKTDTVSQTVKSLSVVSQPNPSIAEKEPLKGQPQQQQNQQQASEQLSQFSVLLQEKASQIVSAIKDSIPDGDDWLPRLAVVLEQNGRRLLSSIKNTAREGDDWLSSTSLTINSVTIPGRYVAIASALGTMTIVAARGLSEGKRRQEQQPMAKNGKAGKLPFLDKGLNQRAKSSTQTTKTRTIPTQAPDRRPTNRKNEDRGVVADVSFIESLRRDSSVPVMDQWGRTIENSINSGPQAVMQQRPVPPTTTQTSPSRQFGARGKTPVDESEDSRVKEAKTAGQWETAIPASTFSQSTPRATFVGAAMPARRSGTSAPEQESNISSVGATIKRPIMPPVPARKSDTSAPEQESNISSVGATIKRPIMPPVPARKKMANNMVVNEKQPNGAQSGGISSLTSSIDQGVSFPRENSFPSNPVVEKWSPANSRNSTESFGTPTGYTASRKSDISLTLANETTTETAGNQDVLPAETTTKSSTWSAPILDGLKSMLKWSKEDEKPTGSRVPARDSSLSASRSKEGSSNAVKQSASTSYLSYLEDAISTARSAIQNNKGTQQTSAIKSAQSGDDVSQQNLGPQQSNRVGSTNSSQLPMDADPSLGPFRSLEADNFLQSRTDSIYFQGDRVVDKPNIEPLMTEADLAASAWDTEYENGPALDGVKNEAIDVEWSQPSRVGKSKQGASLKDESILSNSKSTYGKSKRRTNNDISGQPSIVNDANEDPSFASDANFIGNASERNQYYRDGPYGLNGDDEYTEKEYSSGRFSTDGNDAGYFSEYRNDRLSGQDSELGSYQVNSNVEDYQYQFADEGQNLNKAKTRAFGLNGYDEYIPGERENYPQKVNSRTGFYGNDESFDQSSFSYQRSGEYGLSDDGEFTTSIYGNDQLFSGSPPQDLTCLLGSTKDYGQTGSSMNAMESSGLDRQEVSPQYGYSTNQYISQSFDVQQDVTKRGDSRRRYGNGQNGSVESKLDDSINRKPDYLPYESFPQALRQGQSDSRFGRIPTEGPEVGEKPIIPYEFRQNGQIYSQYGQRPPTTTGSFRGGEPSIFPGYGSNDQVSAKYQEGPAMGWDSDRSFDPYDFGRSQGFSRGSKGRATGWNRRRPSYPHEYGRNGKLNSQVGNGRPTAWGVEKSSDRESASSVQPNPQYEFGQSRQFDRGGQTSQFNNGYYETEGVKPSNLDRYDKGRAIGLSGEKSSSRHVDKKIDRSSAKVSEIRERVLKTNKVGYSNENRQNDQWKSVGLDPLFIDGSKETSVHDSRASDNGDYYCSRADRAPVTSLGDITSNSKLIKPTNQVPSNVDPSSVDFACGGGDSHVEDTRSILSDGLKGSVSNDNAVHDQWKIRTDAAPFAYSNGDSRRPSDPVGQALSIQEPLNLNEYGQIDQMKTNADQYQASLLSNNKVLHSYESSHEDQVSRSFNVSSSDEDGQNDPSRSVDDRVNGSNGDGFPLSDGKAQKERADLGLVEDAIITGESSDQFNDDRRNEVISNDNDESRSIKINTDTASKPNVRQNVKRESVTDVGVSHLLHSGETSNSLKNDSTDQGSMEHKRSDRDPPNLSKSGQSARANEPLNGETYVYPYKRDEDSSHGDAMIWRDDNLSSENGQNSQLKPGIAYVGASRCEDDMIVNGLNCDSSTNEQIDESRNLLSGEQVTGLKSEGIAEDGYSGNKINGTGPNNRFDLKGTQELAEKGQGQGYTLNFDELYSKYEYERNQNTQYAYWIDQVSSKRGTLGANDNTVYFQNVYGKINAADNQYKFARGQRNSRVEQGNSNANSSSPNYNSNIDRTKDSRTSNISTGSSNPSSLIGDESCWWQSSDIHFAGDEEVPSVWNDTYAWMKNPSSAFTNQGTRSDVPWNLETSSISAPNASGPRSIFGNDDDANSQVASSGTMRDQLAKNDAWNVVTDLKAKKYRLSNSFKLKYEKRSGRGGKASTLNEDAGSRWNRSTEQDFDWSNRWETNFQLDPTIQDPRRREPSDLRQENNMHRLKMVHRGGHDQESSHTRKASFRSSYIDKKNYYHR